MGLYIYAYSGLKQTEPERDAYGNAVDPDMCRIWKLEDIFPGMADEFEHESYHLHEKQTSFKVGPYGVYLIWRNELARMAGYPPEAKPRNREAPYLEGARGFEEGEFVEMLYFSDCEGAFGTAVSTKLAADFAKFDNIAKSHTPDPETKVYTNPERFNNAWFYSLYSDFRLAFELASDRGAVCLG